MKFEIGDWVEVIKYAGPGESSKTVSNRAEVAICEQDRLGRVYQIKEAYNTYVKFEQTELEKKLDLELVYYMDSIQLPSSSTIFDIEI